jgi:rubrerythrin
MEFTDPFVGMESRKLSDHELAQALRLDMAAELDAINLYTRHVASTNNPVAKAVIQHIIDEEKEHLAEFHQLLLTLDGVQSEKTMAGRDEIREAGGTPARIDTGESGPQHKAA